MQKKNKINTHKVLYHSFSHSKSEQKEKKNTYENRKKNNLTEREGGEKRKNRPLAASTGSRLPECSSDCIVPGRKKKNGGTISPSRDVAAR